MVGGSSKIPAARELVATALGRDPADGCDPMTAVAQGAAIASAILLGQLDKDFFVATEHALGTVVHDDSGRPGFSVLIPRNHQLPARATDDYLPAVDGQSQVRVRVVEGDPSKPIDHEDNVILHEWEIPVDPARPRVENTISIGYEYSVDGILHVTVTDRLTGETKLRDDVSFGIGQDRAKLVALASDVRAAMDAGSVTGTASAAATSRDPEAQALVARARHKVMPFVHETESRRLADLCAELEQAGADTVDRCKETLASTLRQYAYLF
jgi:molecular chaperone DnaK (HSP70)